MRKIGIILIWVFIGGALLVECGYANDKIASSPALSNTRLQKLTLKDLRAVLKRAKKWSDHVKFNAAYD